MKILMLTPYVPYPPSSGGQIRTLNLLRYLSKKNEITLVALYKKDNEKKYFNHLKQFCKNIYLCKRPENPWKINIILKTILSRLPFLIVRNFSSQAKQVIEQLLNQEQFDVIHAETFYIMPHIPATQTPILLVEQTIEYEVYRHFINTLPAIVKLFFNIDILKLQYWERYYWRKADLVAAVSQSDRIIIRNQEPEIRITMIPNGAGDEMFVSEFAPKNLDKPHILFQGNFFWLQNVEAAHFLIDKIYPQLIKTLPEAKITISGQNAKRIAYKSKNSLEIIDIDSDDINTVKRLYQKATLFIAPIYGPGGTRLKILAAMAAGIPVVSTKTGVEGLGVKDNIHALIAHGARDFTSKISYILKHKDNYQKIRENAYLLVKNNFSWSKIAQKLEMVYKNIKSYEDRD